MTWTRDLSNCLSEIGKLVCVKINFRFCSNFYKIKVYSGPKFSGVKILLAVIIVIRFVAMVMGCFYGPYIYIVLPLGGLYLAADALLLHTVRGGKFVPEIIKDCGKIGYSGLLVLFMGREGRRKIDKNIIEAKKIHLFAGILIFILTSFLQRLSTGFKTATFKFSNHEANLKSLYHAMELFSRRLFGLVSAQLFNKFD